MSAEGSVTRWVDQLKAGDQAAARELWERYFQRLVALGRAKLQGHARRVADEEDVALSAFDSFCRGAEQGRFPQLEDRDNLWRLLVVITTRKAADLVQHDRRQKRGGGKVHDEAAVLGLTCSWDEAPGLEGVIGKEPTPEYAAQVAEECQRLLGRLGDAQLRSIAVWKMEGYTNAEIATKLDCVPSTVERKLRLIRERWARELLACDAAGSGQ